METSSIRNQKRVGFFRILFRQIVTLIIIRRRQQTDNPIGSKRNSVSSNASGDSFAVPKVGNAPSDHLTVNSRKRRFGTSRLSSIWRSDRDRDLLYSDEEATSVFDPNEDLSDYKLGISS
ncbi:hypothetical protein WR25_19900 [Diploscapter pachys]|uniref:Uncharacterized protein n=1 Tax=Diploscapter pachys TaxID=2018661 RepID=A0A2A2JWV3_9BILA|nr:hypothetical protein WR25_19900 [Diploscapter pachys]